MAQEKDGMTADTHEGQVSLRSYTVGFAVSVLLTLAAYYLVTAHVLVGTSLMLAIAALAVIQLVVQFVFFLHLSLKPKSRSHLFVFLFMVIIVVIIAFGSIWIMNNLNYKMNSMSPPQMETYMKDNQGF